MCTYIIFIFGHSLWVIKNRFIASCTTLLKIKTCLAKNQYNCGPCVKGLTAVKETVALLDYKNGTSRPLFRSISFFAPR